MSPTTVFQNGSYTKDWRYYAKWNLDKTYKNCFYTSSGSHMLDSRTTLILENTYSVTPGFIAPVSDHRKMRIALASSHARTVLYISYFKMHLRRGGSSREWISLMFRIFILRDPWAELSRLLRFPDHFFFYLDRIKNEVWLFSLSLSFEENTC